MITENARALFEEESREHLQDIESVLLAMEQAGSGAGTGYVDQAFRAAHSIKGGAGFLGYERIRDVAHAVEDALDLIRDGAFFPDRRGFDVLLRAFDILGMLLSDPEGSETADTGEILAELSMLPKERFEERPEPVEGGNEGPVPEESGLSIEDEEVPGRDISASESVRVPVAVLDRLMNLAGELVLGRNRLEREAAGSGSRELVNAVQQISQVATEMQDEVMTARMLPLGRIVQRFPRQVRDLAGRLGKEIELTMHGLDVGIDKGLLDRLVEPLGHLVRNAVDHGIESPAERRELGKSPRGRVELRARHGAGQIHIELRDDGRGMDEDLLVERAVARGALSAEEGQGLSPGERLDLAMLPGVSCAGAVTDLSGRGVGMDVVKTLLDEVGGRIELKSEVGRGTRVRLSFPPTLVVMPCVLVRAGEERYALPQAGICELLRIPGDRFRRETDRAGQRAMLHIRGQAVPVSGLARILHAPDRKGDLPGVGNSGGHVHVVVVRSGSARHALVVDRTEDVLDAVTRPLGRWLRGCPAYSGVTLLRDGTPALILDVSGLLHLAGAEVTEVGETEAMAKSGVRERDGSSGSLLFRNAPDEYFVLPLQVVDRVERIAARDIALIGGRKVIRLSDGTVPVYALEEVLRVGVLEDGRDLVCIVMSSETGRFGLLASGPLETLEEEVVPDPGGGTHPGVRGTCPVPGGTATVLDLKALQGLFQDTGSTSPVSASEPEAGGRVVLVVDDSQFFRTRIAEVLGEQGIPVVMAGNGSEAWEYLDRHAQNVGLVVTDLEMPVMDGFQLARKINGDARFETLGVVALSSLAAPEDMEAAAQAGADDYLVKLDEEQLMAAVRKRFEN
jgi:two-component system chemotaxis sensor kinase CheA